MNKAQYHIEQTLLRQRALRAMMFTQFSQLSVRLSSFEQVQEALADELDRVDAKLQILRGGLGVIT